MINLEQEIVELRAQLDMLAERARLDAVAEEFLAQKVSFRVGDVFTHGGEIYRLGNINYEGKWTVAGMNDRCFEPHVLGEVAFEGAARLYTAGEVAEILAKARKQWPACVDPFHTVANPCPSCGQYANGKP